MLLPPKNWLVKVKIRKVEWGKQKKGDLLIDSVFDGAWLNSFLQQGKKQVSYIWANGDDDAAKTAILIWYLIERCLTYLQIGLEFSGDSFNTSKFLNDHLRAQHHICVVWILVVVIKDYNITIWKSRGQNGQNWNTYLSSSASYLNFPLLTMRFSPISVNSISFCLLISLCL